MKLKVCLFIILALIMVSEYGAICCFLDDDDDSGSSSPPDNPSHLVAVCVSKSQVNLFWIDESHDEDKFIIEREIGPSDSYAEVARTNAGIESYSDTGLVSETLYYYRIRAYSYYGGYSGPSNEVPVMTFLNEPTGLTSTAISAVQIDISWTDNSNQEEECRIERKEGLGGTYVQVDTVNAGITSYSDIGLTGGTTYYYRVKAYCPNAGSAYSNETNATTY